MHGKHKALRRRRKEGVNRGVRFWEVESWRFRRERLRESGFGWRRRLAMMAGIVGRGREGLVDAVAGGGC